MDDYLVNATGLKKSYGANHAVDGVSLYIPAGEIYGRVDAEGAGKTTTRRLVVGGVLRDAGGVKG